MTEAIVRIDSLAFGGAGFGRIDGKACFVPFTAPGDLARVRIAVAKPSFLEGELVELLERSPMRAVPPCPVFGTCGGCSWQHLNYEAQREAKRSIYAETLWRFGRVPPEVIGAAVAAPEPYGYRSRVQFKIRWSGGRLHIGFYRRGSHYVVDIPGGCAICHPVLNRVLAEIRPVLARFSEPDRIPQVDAAVGDDGAALIIVHYIGTDRRAAREFFAANREDLPSVTGLHLQLGRKETIEEVWGIEALSYRVPDGFLPGVPETSLSFSRGGFSQVNYRQNLELVRAVGRLARAEEGMRILDLYCGNGNFSLPLAQQGGRVVGVEEYGPSLDDARRNASANGISSIEFIQADAAEGIRMLRNRGDRFPVVVLDPPRTGAKEAVAGILALAPERIVYVSCDPTTLARDVGMICKAGYRVCESFPVDMFPQTYHIESVTLLQKTD
ncbi:23S rRNA (uracil(1939)-C(5))-methyltransferase RlmD [Geobacter pickeringii]|uniref:RNA methyltransferase n=1 Tax=Geobacter pickeringii TaxID=345632 RepID=A0A0B5BIA3_9BACT|nr:23S rRNA (uracil(1939)-C(5))-methyltransferase RlmD [Geobacter pickeringii]AJE04864.1 RNA methyltransferase [Geobacter pickeringii]